jgi:hypothetical protein
MSGDDTSDGRDAEDGGLIDIDRGMDDTIARIEADQHDRSDEVDEADGKDTDESPVEESERIETAEGKTVHGDIAKIAVEEIGKEVEVTICGGELPLREEKLVDTPGDEIQVPEFDFDTVEEMVESVHPFVAARFQSNTVEELTGSDRNDL